jgi:hypothetical protein
MCRPEDSYGVVGVHPEANEEEEEEEERLNEYAPLMGPSRISISRYPAHPFLIVNLSHLTMCCLLATIACFSKFVSTCR